MKVLATQGWIFSVVQNFFRITGQFCPMKVRVVVSLLFCVLSGVLLGQQRSLDFYIVSARRNSPFLHGYDNQQSAYQLDGQTLNAQYGPQVTANSNLMYAPTYHHWGYDPAITNGRNISALMSISKSLIGKEHLASRLEDFSLQSKAAGTQRKLSVRELELTVTDRYLNCYGAQEQYALSEKMLALLRTEDQALKKLAQAAVIKQTDYLNFKVTLQQQLLSTEQIKAQLLNAYSALNYSCGLEDSSLISLAVPAIEIVPLPPFEQSLYNQSYQTDSLISANQEKMINYEYKPKVDLFADAGYQSAIPAQAYKNWGLSIGLNFSLPVYDGKQKQTALLKNKIEADTRQKYRDFYRHQYHQQIMQLTQQMAQTEELNRTATSQVVYAKTLMEANKKQLGSGDVRMSEYLQSVSNYLNLQAALIQQNIDRLSLINQLNHLIVK